MAPKAANEALLADLLSPAFARDGFRVHRGRPLTFVCGGNNYGATLALRHQFLREIGKAPPRILPVLAERAFPHQLIEQNLHKFETFLAKVADCVLIFVESPGSFAETGMFAALSNVVPKTLVVNTCQEAARDSFLNRGPIKLIRKKSRFETVLDLPNKAVTAADANNILDAIHLSYPKFKKALVFHPLKKFTDLDLRLQLASVYVAVTLIHAGSESLVTSILRSRFGAVDQEAVERFLSVLTSINLLGREDEIYFNPNPNAFENDSLIQSVDFSVDNVRARSLEWHEENNSQVAVFLRERRGVDI
jgi:hypothetical protein